jgi:uncharacterized protein YbaR (Trm112 family)
MDTLLHLLRCPLTHEPFSKLTDAELAWINSRIAESQLRNRGDEPVENQWLQGLVNESRTWVYPIYGHGAALIADEAVAGDELKER